MCAMASELSMAQDASVGCDLWLGMCNVDGTGCFCGL